MVKAYSFKEDADQNIKKLIRTYYDYIASGDYSLATLLTNDSSRLSMEDFLEKGNYIEEVKSLTCYSMESVIEGSYIVIAKCGVQTTLCPELITILEAFYVCTNESGTQYICSSAVGDEVKSYNSIMLSDSFVTSLIDEVAEGNEAVIAKYEDVAVLKGIVIPENGIFRYLYEAPVTE